MSLAYNGEESEQRDVEHIFDTNIDDILKTLLNHTLPVPEDDTVDNVEQVSIKVELIYPYPYNASISTTVTL